MAGGRLAKTTELVRSAASETRVRFKLAVVDGCVWPSPPSRLQWLASSPPTSLVDRRPVLWDGWQVDARVDGRNGQYQLYYGYAHHPILQRAIGGPPTRVGGREKFWPAALGVGQCRGDVGRHVGPRQ